MLKVEKIENGIQISNDKNYVIITKNENQWITVKGTHILLKDGEDREKALKKFFAKKKKEKEQQEQLGEGVIKYRGKILKLSELSGEKLSSIKQNFDGKRWLGESYDIYAYKEVKKEIARRNYEYEKDFAVEYDGKTIYVNRYSTRRLEKILKDLEKRNENPKGQKLIRKVIQEMAKYEYI